MINLIVYFQEFVNDTMLLFTGEVVRKRRLFSLTSPSSPEVTRGAESHDSLLMNFDNGTYMITSLM